MNKQSLVYAALAILIGVFVFFVFNSFINKTVSRVLVTAVFPVDTDILVSASSDPRAESVVDIISVKSKKGISQYVGTARLDIPFEELTIQFRPIAKTFDESDNLDVPPLIDIHSVQIKRPYRKDIFVGARRVETWFTAMNEPDEGMSRIGIANVGGATILVKDKSLNQPSYLSGLALAIIFAVGFFLIFRAANWAAIPAFSDITLGREISSSHEFGTINGIRGIAALLVLLSHTAPGFFAVQVGLAMLFVISGFLLSKPFILNPNRIFNLNNIEVFLVKRLKRILPMYYLYIFIMYVVSLELDVALRHILFLQADGHLWPMTQIFVFYMMLPFILLVTSLLFRFNRILPIILLCSVAWYWWMEMREWQPFYNGRFFNHFFFYAFLLGVAASYVQYGFIAGNKRLQALFKNWSWLLSLVGLAVLFFTIAWSAPMEPPSSIKPFIAQFFTKCVLCVLIILFALNSYGTFLNAFISNWLFRSVGIVGFSFYILHGLGMQIVLNAQSKLLAIPDPSSRSWSFMLMTFVVTYLMSIVAYSYVERPFFGYRRRANNVE